MDVVLAASAKGSLMMLTVNSRVARMFASVSFSPPRLAEKETLTRGGLCEIWDGG